VVLVNWITSTGDYVLSTWLTDGRPRAGTAGSGRLHRGVHGSLLLDDHARRLSRSSSCWSRGSSMPRASRGRCS
jgi:hypothetical protein